jgi:hypothetical protein
MEMAPEIMLCYVCMRVDGCQLESLISFLIQNKGPRVTR